MTDQSRYKSGNEAWLDSIKEVMTTGLISKPRGLETKEILNQVMFFDMRRPICHHSDRKLSYQFMAAEAYWITSGSPLVEDIAPYNKHISQFSDDGYIFNGAYGPAFLSQVNFVVNTLVKDPNSRQAVLTIWHPNPVDTKDHKCTVALVFNIRAGVIHTTVLMRSNDLILGRPYDMFNFTIMTLRVLTQINHLTGHNYDLGTMSFHAVSAHIYEDKYEMSRNLITNDSDSATIIGVPNRALIDWQFVVDSLLACRDNDEESIKENNLWRIRPCV